MNSKLNKAFGYGLLACAAAVVMTQPALAQGSGDIFVTLQSKTTSTFTNVRNIAYIIAGFGLIAIAVMAYFGRFNFKHLAGLIGGLVIIAAAAAFINYVTGQAGNGQSTQSTPGFTDTFTAQ